MSTDSAIPSETPDRGPQLMPPPVPLPGHAGQPVEGHAAAVTGSMEPAQLPGPTLDEATKQEFLWHTHGYLGEYSRFADTKAAFGGTIAAALLGALYTAKVHVPIMRTSSMDQWGLATLMAVAAAFFLFVSIALAIWTISPRLRSTQSKGFIYWGNIAAHGNVELLQTSFHSQSARTLNDHLLHHVFDISSKVCLPKYRLVSLCLWALGLGGALCVAALILQDASRQAVHAPPTAAVTTPNIDAKRP